VAALASGTGISASAATVIKIKRSDRAKNLFIKFHPPKCKSLIVRSNIILHPGNKQAAHFSKYHGGIYLLNMTRYRGI
jgi:hypothetical protein